MYWRTSADVRKWIHNILVRPKLQLASVLLAAHFQSLFLWSLYGSQKMAKAILKQIGIVKIKRRVRRGWCGVGGVRRIKKRRVEWVWEAGSSWIGWDTKPNGGVVWRGRKKGGWELMGWKGHKTKWWGIDEMSADLRCEPMTKRWCSN